MKRFAYTIILALICYNIYPNNKIQQSVIKKQNQLYIISCNVEYLVNNIITVKSDSPNETKGKYCVIRENKLGYSDIKIPDSLSVYDFLSTLEKDDNITNIDYNGFGSYNTLTPNDTYTNTQWHLAAIRALNAWDITTGNSDIKIGILDSGTDWMHPDLGLGTDSYQNIYCNQHEDDWVNQYDPTTGNNIDNDGNGLIDDYKGWNFDANSNDSRGVFYHGTFVAGIVGAKTNNNFGTCGVAGGYGSNGVSLVPYCVGLYQPNSEVIDDAIISAVDNGIRIIQFSLSIPSTNAIVNAIQYAADHEVAVICAAGNNYSSSLSFPASDTNVIAVGAIDTNFQRADFSNYGTNLSIVAPGVDIYGLNHSSNTDLYRTESGTSFAAPQVSATLGLMLSINPSLSRNELKYIIESTAQKLDDYSFLPSSSAHPNGSWNKYVGYGLLDAYAAVLAAKDKYIQNHTYGSGNTIVESYPEIYAGYAVTDVIPYGDVVIQSGSNVTFKATRAIHLNPGFRVEPGATFKAIIETPAQTSPTPSYIRRHETSVTNSNGDDKNENIVPQSYSTFAITPNPAHTNLHIQSSGELSQAKIYNLNGQCVLQTNETDIDVSALPQGMYILRAETIDGTVHQAKFIKQ